MRESLPLSQGVDVTVGVGPGGQYLVVPVAGRSGPAGCAPRCRIGPSICVRSGRTSPWTVVHHSATGTVDIYRTLARRLGARVRGALCSQLPLGRTVLAAA